MLRHCRTGIHVGCVMLAGYTLASPPLPALAKAEYRLTWDGLRLLENCEKGTDNCSGYILGVIDMFAVTRGSGQLDSRGLDYCLPPATRTGDLTNRVVQYLRSVPRDLDKPAATLMIYAVSTAFPCR
jgi:hypothetical protein